MRRSRECGKGSDFAAAMDEWHDSLVDRRRFLLQLAGGSLAALFGLPALGATEDLDHNWKVLDAVQCHLFPSEPQAPGAREINALGYLRYMLDAPRVDAHEKSFLLKGCNWLEGMSQELTGGSFLTLDEQERERVLRRIAASKAGENWLSLLLYYLMEALLSDPVYGGNPDGIGWRWLEHIPGYPRPPLDKTYPRLLS